MSASRRVQAPSLRLSATESGANTCRPSGTCTMPARTRACGESVLHRLAVERDGAARNRLHAGNRAQQRGLAGAVAADQRDHLALRDLKRHLVQHRDAAVAGIELRRRAAVMRALRDRPSRHPDWRAPRRAVPSASVRPWSSTWMRLEIFITSFMSCSTSSTVTPEAATFWITASTSCGLDRIAAGGGLVEQQHLRLGRERAGDLEPLQRAIRHRAGWPVGERAEADEREQFLGLWRASRGSAAAPTAARTDAAADCARSCRWRPTITFSAAVMRKKICRFWNVRDSPRRASRCGASPVTSSPPKRDAPARGRVDAGNDVEQRGLAGAVRSDDGEDLARLDCERHARDRGHAAERDRDVI